MLTLRNVSRIYRAAEIHTAALEDISLTIGAGEFVAITGPSGCGKSTLLNILGMLDVPSTGEYQFFGERVHGLSEGALALLRRQGVACIFQNFNLLPGLTVAENCALPLEYRKLPAGEKCKRVHDALECVGLGHRANHLPRQLSGGQQQRTAIARALVTEPRVLLADEPTGNLDSEQGTAIMNMLTSVSSAGCTVVMVTHSPEHAAYARRTVRMLDGRISSEAISSEPIASGLISSEPREA
jgi:putative ABC transport system ATP-binding protein